jgi:hypothetical protein
MHNPFSSVKGQMTVLGPVVGMAAYLAAILVTEQRPGRI